MIVLEILWSKNIIYWQIDELLGNDTTKGFRYSWFLRPI